MLARGNKAIITEQDFNDALAADSPTLAWLIDQDGTVTIIDMDDVSRASTPGAWPRLIGRTFLAKRLLDRHGEVESAVKEINSVLLRGQ